MSPALQGGFLAIGPSGKSQMRVLYIGMCLLGLPWGLRGKEATCQCRRHRFNPWVGTIPWKRTCNPLQYSCLGNPMERSLVGYSSQGCKRVRHDLMTKQHNTVAGVLAEGNLDTDIHTHKKLRGEDRGRN